MPTIRDVARLAGVAPITVSRVINKSGYASEETVARVEDAIAKLQYVPNTLSQSLRHGGTNTIALLLSDITNPFWTTVTRGVEDVSSESGLNVFLCNTDENPEKLKRYVDALLQRQTDGFLVVPAGDDLPVVEKIVKQHVPIVLIDRPLSNQSVDVVRSDSEGGAFQLTEYLIRQRHRRIAMIAGPPQIATSMQRLHGYHRAMATYRLSVNPAWMRHGQVNTETNENSQITRQLMTLDPRPTAIFAGNNFIAVGVLQALHEMGIRIPKDVSLVCFDDLPFSWPPEPFLTVASQSPYHMGYRATKLLLSIINGDEKPGNRDIVLPVKLIIRQSTAEYLEP